MWCPISVGGHGGPGFSGIAIHTIVSSSLGWGGRQYFKQIFQDFLSSSLMESINSCVIP